MVLVRNLGLEKGSRRSCAEQSSPLGSCLLHRIGGLIGSSRRELLQSLTQEISELNDFSVTVTVGSPLTPTPDLWLFT